MLGKIVAIVMLALAAFLAAAAPASAYSASQAEAMTDPSTADPYTFPKVKPCCGAKPDPCANGGCSVVKPRPRPCWERPSGCRPASRPVRPSRPCYGEGCYRPSRPAETLHVRCDGGGDTRTLQEAIDLVQDGDGTVYVYGGFPGGTCRGSLRITGSVTLIGVGEGPNRQRPELESGPGPCLVVAGSRARARIVDMNIIAAGGPACIDISGGTLRLEGVNVNAAASGAAVIVRSGWFSAARSASTPGTWIFGGGPAVMAQSSDVLISDTRLQSAAAFAYAPFASVQPPGGYAPSGPGYPPIRYIDDPDAPYGGGRLPESNPWPGSDAPRPAPPRPINTWPQALPGPVYGQPVYGSPYPPPSGNPYAVAPVLNPAPAPFSGTPVLVLDESQGLVQRSEILGGTTGVAAVISSSRTGRDLRIRDTLIKSERGATGLLAVASGGWSGLPSRVIVEGRTEVTGFDTGVSLNLVGATINSVSVTAGYTGISADKGAYGVIYAPRVSARGRCFRFDGDGFSGDRPGRLSVSAASCSD